TYGPGLRNLAVWEITRRAITGQHTIQGTGTETRDYLYSSDVALALCRVADRASFEGETINVASGKEVSIAALAQKIYSNLGLDAPPQVNHCPGEGKPTRWCADISKLRAIGFEEEVTLEDGIRTTVEWIKSNS